MKALLAVVLACGLAPSARAAGQGAPSGFMVLSVSGGKLSAGGRKAGAGTFLRWGETLRLSGGRAIVRLGSQGKVMLKGQTRARLLSAREQGFELLHGAILSALPHLRGPFYVRTQTVTAAVRGTEFFVETLDKGSAYVCVCRGAVDAYHGTQRPAQGVIRLAGEHHRAWSFALDRGTLVQKDDVLRDHDDGDLAELR